MKNRNIKLKSRKKCSKCSKKCSQRSFIWYSCSLSRFRFTLRWYSTESTDYFSIPEEWYSESNNYINQIIVYK